MSSMIQFEGLEKLEQALNEQASLKPVKKIIQKAGAELNNETVSNMQTVYTKGYSKKNNVNNTSLEIQNGGLKAVQTTQTDHIIYNEYGTRYMEAEPAIKPAFDKAVQNVKRELNNLTK